MHCCSLADHSALTALILGSFQVNRPPRLHLLKAEDLPRTTSDLSDQLTPRVPQALTHVDLPDGSSDHELLCSLEAALGQLSAPGPLAIYTAAERAQLPEDGYEEHDMFFRVARVTVGRSRLEAFLRPQLEAYLGHLSDTLSLRERTPLSAEQSDDLRDGFDATFALLRRHSPNPCSRQKGSPPRAQQIERYKPDPLVRWILGHHCFFAMIQGMLTALNCASSAVRSKESSAPEYIDTATIIMRASAAALRYAGDFSPIEYARRVRPAMMPPNLGAKFSGLQSRDHRCLLRALADLRKLLGAQSGANSEGRMSLSYGRFVAEMRATYDAHKYVCARFGGDSEPSLRMNPSAQVSATVALERLKEARIQAASF
jgi:hypothetical protein